MVRFHAEIQVAQAGRKPGTPKQIPPPRQAMNLQSQGNLKTTKLRGSPAGQEGEPPPELSGPHPPKRTRAPREKRTDTYLTIYITVQSS